MGSKTPLRDIKMAPLVNTFHKKEIEIASCVIESDTASFGKSKNVLRITWRFIGTLGLGSYISDHSRISAQNLFHSTNIAPMRVSRVSKYINKTIIDLFLALCYY